MHHQAPPLPERSPGRDTWDRFTWLLLAAALLTRLVWVIAVHPPADHVFSDMAHYIARAQRLVSEGFVLGDRHLAWQAWGTHTLLALPLWLVGPDTRAALEVAGLMWAAISAGTVVLAHRLAARVLPSAWGAWPARAVGLLMLVWIPAISHTGFFISETPYAFVLLAATLGTVELVHEGGDRRAVRAGLWGALAFALRPQCAVFFVLLLGARALDRLRMRRGSGRSGVGWSRRVDLRRALLFALPLVLMLGFSLVRVRVHAGEWAGVAESGTMNLTAGRCHNIVTQAFPDAEALAASDAAGSTQDGRRISLPGFRAFARLPADHPLALRPALGGESIKLVGYVGDAEVHRRIRARCYAATGWLEQLRFSLVNAIGLWVIDRPWPESSDLYAPELFPVAMRGRDLAALLAPLSLLATLVFGLRLARTPGLGLCALQIASLVLVSALVFGTTRLRAPYDPYALILVVALLGHALAWVRRRGHEGARALRSPSTGPLP